MFKDEYPATYRAVMAHLRRQKRAAANDRDDEAPTSTVCVSIRVAPPAQSDVSISIDVAGARAASKVTAATPPSPDHQMRATVVIRSAS